jgi:hypothetical protein
VLRLAEEQLVADNQEPFVSLSDHFEKLDEVVDSPVRWTLYVSGFNRLVCRFACVLVPTAFSMDCHSL